MTSTIDKQKIVEWIKELKQMMYEQEQPLMNKKSLDARKAGKMLTSIYNEISKINTGEFNCEGGLHGNDN